MITLNLKSLVDKLSDELKDSLEGAAGLCMSRSQYNVEIEHWLIKLLEKPESDLSLLLDRYEIDKTLVHTSLNRVVERFKNGSSRAPALSASLVDIAKQAWMLASVEFSHPVATSSHLLAAVLLDDTYRQSMIDSCKPLKNIAPEGLRETIPALFGESVESSFVLMTKNNPAEAQGETFKPSKTPALDQYTVNLTDRAKNGDIDPVLGRDQEIRQLIDILTRRRQNNPILTGEAGVGKTAVVEGFALRISSGDVPTPLRGVHIHTLDLGLLQAGASVKGEFENRLKSVIAEVKASVTPIIMFIDEAHTMIGAGGKEGQGDAANLLKPALARGELRTIAATTWAEYKKYFERDPALTRRFQVVKVEEPSETVAIEMMRGIAKSLQQHHNVKILDEAIIESVKLSHRYIPARQLPDKSVSLLDTACARVSLSQSTTPSAIEDMQRSIRETETTIERIAQEDVTTGIHTQYLKELEDKQLDARKGLQSLQHQWQGEKELIEKIQVSTSILEQDFTQQHQADYQPLTQTDISQHRKVIAELRTELAELQQKQGMIQAEVNAESIADVVANWTGIPVGKMMSDEITAVLDLQTTMQKRVIGQNHALAEISQAVQTARAGLRDPRKPLGVFMMVGPSGTGKTETALTLADQIYGGEQNLTVINMSEFKEEHKVSMLLGSPPGYVGYGEGGVLTEAARRKPYSVILLDEMEKAHPGVQDIFYNLFDKGSIKDGEGRDIDFKNCIIIMTSNAGEQAIRQICASQEVMPDPEVLYDSFRPELLKHFKPAFLGRTTVIPFYPLQDDVLFDIAKINMQRIESRIAEHYAATLSYNDEVLLQIVARCHEVDTGARNIENILSRNILPELAGQCLALLAEGKQLANVHIGSNEDGEFTYRLTNTSEKDTLDAENTAEA